MNRYNATLYFRDEESALEAGYPDAVRNDDDPEFPYMAVITFFADAYDVEEDDDLFEFEVAV
jgi:hypothetical protein